MLGFAFWDAKAIFIKQNMRCSSVQEPDICLIIYGRLCSLSPKSHFNVKSIFLKNYSNKSSAQAKKLNAESPALTLKWILDTLL